MRESGLALLETLLAYETLLSMHENHRRDEARRSTREGVAIGLSAWSGLCMLSVAVVGAIYDGESMLYFAVLLALPVWLVGLPVVAFVAVLTMAMWDVLRG